MEPDADRRAFYAWHEKEYPGDYRFASVELRWELFKRELERIRATIPPDTSRILSDETAKRINIDDKTEG